MWTGITLARYLQWNALLNLARWTFLFILTIPVNLLRGKVSDLSLSAASTMFGRTETASLIIGFVIIGVFLLARFQRGIMRAATTFVIITSPFVLYTFSQAAWPLLQHARSNMTDKPLAPPLASPQSRAPRILWFVFDGLDQYVAFDGRPTTVKLPEVDRFRSESIYATRVSSPANETLESMPALITGKRVSKAEPADSNDLRITVNGTTKPVRWSSLPNIFSKAREAGFNTALSGWYHPYCRIIGTSLSNCTWESWSTDIGIRSGATWYERMVWLPHLIDSLPLSSALNLSKHLESSLGINLPKRKAYTEVAIPSYLRILRDAKRFATDPNLNLILVHWPVPHPPGIYDHFKHDFALDGRGGFLGNLELVDRTLAEVRNAMESVNLWDKTIILITADHPYRFGPPNPSWTSDHQEILSKEEVGRYIPFLLKLPGQKEPIVYDQPFNSVITADLFMAFLRNELSGPKSTVNWIHKHSLPQAPHSSPFPH